MTPKWQELTDTLRHWRDESLCDDKDLEISVVNSLGREIHKEFVHREK